MTIYIDEAGRGPLAGPVWVGAIVPLKRFSKQLFQDSKILSEKQRHHAYQEIVDLESSGKVLFGSGTASNKEIDRNGIIRSLQRSIRRALFHLIKKHQPDLLGHGRGCYRKKVVASNWVAGLIIDGNHTFGLDMYFPVETIIKGDQKNPLISMASIVAKVERDRFMEQQSEKFPAYGFDRHKGYGTKLHREAIVEHGPSSLHRMSFCGNVLGIN